LTEGTKLNCIALVSKRHNAHYQLLKVKEVDMSDTKKRRTHSGSRSDDNPGFVTVNRRGGWQTDIPALVNSKAYQQQLDAVKDLVKKGHFTNRKSA
jgi:hypothetical protein